MKSQLENGGDGSKSRSSGSNGKDEIIRVPVGTVVKDSDTNQILYESINDGDKKIVVEGGKGGLGNWNFKSPTNQTPRYAQPGISGVEKKLTIELKVLADVGLVGLPNSGKSTLLSVLTDAKPKIANYEFTTLKPNLGIVKHRDYNTFVISDNTITPTDGAGITAYDGAIVVAERNTISGAAAGSGFGIRSSATVAPAFLSLPFKPRGNRDSDRTC